MSSVSESSTVEHEKSDEIIEIEGVSVAFPTGNGESRVLDNVDLSVERGETLGIVGESGSGKSMLASSMLDAVEEPGKTTGDVTYYPSEGDPISVLDLDAEGLNEFRWEQIAMVFQGALDSFNPTMKIKGHFEETLKAHDADLQAGMERARQLLSDLYLDPDRVLDSYAHELSGGMSQRTLIALSLVLEPDVLVMDEPTAALDLLMQRSIVALLRDLAESYDLTLIFITHDLPLVAKLADRLAVVYAFEIAELGPTEEILRSAAHPYTRSLLQATPNLNAPLGEMEPIEGSAPNPANVPSGCSYHTRCPIATDMCSQNDPSLDTVDGDHRAACFYPDEARKSVTLEFGTDEPVTTTADRSVRSEQIDDTVVSLENLEVHFEMEGGVTDMFSDSETVQAVDGVNLDIHENEVVALIGESGCGKTTLGKAAIGLERPTDGSVKYRGQDIWETRTGHGDVDIPFSEIRRSLQIVHQDPESSLNPNKRIIESLTRPLKKWKPNLSREEREAQVLAMLDRVGMIPPSDYAYRYPHQLSGGEAQRVALVRTLMMNPDLILADEAISALDVSLRVEMMDLMLELQDAFDTSYLFISHDLSNARYLAEKSDGRIGVMYLGELVEIGPVEQIIHNPQHPYTKVLMWATPELNLEGDDEDLEPPLRSIDIPDPKDPPAGCRFHTRCPKAREACTQQPPAYDVDGTGKVACFRADPDHEYWDSEPLESE